MHAVTRFQVFLRSYFPREHFDIVVQQWPYRHAIMTSISAATADTTPCVDMKCLIADLDGVVVDRKDDETMTVIEGQFEGQKCKVTIFLPLLVPTRS
jgi:hypothetical protein